MSASSGGGEFAYVSNFGSDNVSVIDLATNTVAATVGVGDAPVGVAFTPDGAFAYVANVFSDNVSVIDLVTKTVTTTISVGNGPHAVAVTPDGAFAYVTNIFSDNVSVVDLATNTVTATVGVGVNPRRLAVNPVGAFAYVTNANSNNMSVIDLATNTVTATVGVGEGPLGVAVTADGSFAYVANSLSDNVTVIDLATNTVIAKVGVGDHPRGMAVTPDGAFAYVTNALSDNVSVIDLATNTVTATVGVGDAPAGVAVTPDGSFAYVVNHSSDNVSVIDVATNMVTVTVGVGGGPSDVAIMPALSSNAGLTPTGSEIVVSPTDETTGEPSGVTLTFKEVTASGETTVTTSGTGAPPPESFRLGSPPVYYEIDTTATFTGTVEVCIDYSGQSFPNEQNLRLMHDDGSGWVDVTSLHDAENDIICGIVDSLSPFVIFQANTTPVAGAGGPYAGDEGGTVSLSLSGSDEDGDALSYAWDLGDGTTGSGAILPADHIYADDGVYTISLTASDEFGGSHTATTTATIANVAPILDEITAPVDPQSVGTSVAIGSTYADAGVLDTHTATIDWNDGSPAEVIDVSDGSVAASYTYAASGVYRIRMTVADNDGGVSNEQIFEYVVVYDRDGGFVTGGGWIDSPPGAYVPDPDLTGKATFGFVSKYQNGATTPSGNTEFQFKAAAFTFESSSYQWLVVSGARAQFKGEGTVNGSGTYKFLLTATDGEVNGGGGVDRFRIKITDLNDHVIYDNVPGASDQIDEADPQAITRGSIVIHK